MQTWWQCEHSNKQSNDKQFFGLLHILITKPRKKYLQIVLQESIYKVKKWIFKTSATIVCVLLRWLLGVEGWDRVPGTKGFSKRVKLGGWVQWLKKDRSGYGWGGEGWGSGSVWILGSRGGGDSCLRLPRVTCLAELPLQHHLPGYAGHLPIGYSVGPGPAHHQQRKIRFTVSTISLSIMLFWLQFFFNSIWHLTALFTLLLRLEAILPLF